MWLECHSNIVWKHVLLYIKKTWLTEDLIKKIFTLCPSLSLERSPVTEVYSVETPFTTLTIFFHVRWQTWVLFLHQDKYWGEKKWRIHKEWCTVIPAMVQCPCFSINVQHLSHRFALTGGQWLKHRWERLTKTHKIAFLFTLLHISGRVA